MIGTGLVTLAWWVLRARGETTPPRELRIAGRAILIAGTLLGYVVLLPEIAGAPAPA